MALSCGCTTGVCGAGCAGDGRLGTGSSTAIGAVETAAAAAAGMGDAAFLGDGAAATGGDGTRMGDCVFMDTLASGSRASAGFAGVATCSP